ncbi:hypothetical protein C4573_04990 [Candidatus Woesearchaeota archaeon]|nr:MAG: hypothetical protein C4573_04990 [Candidatus Woesearchaeota archaeon]
MTLDDHANSLGSIFDFSRKDKKREQSQGPFYVQQDLLDDTKKRLIGVAYVASLSHILNNYIMGVSGTLQLAMRNQPDHAHYPERDTTHVAESLATYLRTLRTTTEGVGIDTFLDMHKVSCDIYPAYDAIPFATAMLQPLQRIAELSLSWKDTQKGAFYNAETRKVIASIETLQKGQRLSPENIPLCMYVGNSYIVDVQKLEKALR